MKLLKEPLFHFLLIGAALFALYEFSDSETQAETDRQIVVTAGRIEQLANIFAKTWQRPPTADEMKGLIDDFVLEEIYYRQAVAMGIDQNDTMIRRRLRQKLEFLTEDAASLVEPSDEDLAKYLADHPGQFRAEPTYTFRQVYFNPEKHGSDPQATVRALAEKLRGGDTTVQGDHTLLPETFEDASVRIVDGTFGTGFAGQLDALTVGDWSNPVPSGLGLHLVKLDARTPGRLPSLDEIRPAVLREWSNQNRLEVREQFNKALLKDYDITIDWPETGDQDPES